MEKEEPGAELPPALTVMGAWQTTLVQGVSALAAGFGGAPHEGRGWWIFFGFISLIGGIVITALPAESVTLLAALTGIWFIVQSLFEIAGGLMLRRAGHQEQATVTGPPSRPSEGAAAL